MENLKITSFDDLKSYAQGQAVELPPFADGMPFVARLKRPSLLAMMKTGKIPNALLNTANDLFVNATHQRIKNDPETLKEVFEVMELLTEAALVEPTAQQVKDAGLELTDDQLMFLFNYTQRGVQALQPFRKVETNNASAEHGELLQTESE